MNAPRSPESSRKAHALGRIAFAVAAAITVAWVVAIDLLAAAAWLHPLAWAVALAPAATLAVLVWVRRDRATRAAKRMCSGAFLLGVLVVLVPWNERKRFVHAVFSVRVGMSVDDVEAVMVGYTKGMGAKWHLPNAPQPLVRGSGEAEGVRSAETAGAPPDAYRAPEYPAGEGRLHVTGTMTYRWSDDATFDADWGQVAFIDGKAAKVEFLPD
jgi:hypothetical protein